MAFGFELYFIASIVVLVKEDENSDIVYTTGICTISRVSATRKFIALDLKCMYRERKLRLGITFT